MLLHNTVYVLLLAIARTSSAQSSSASPSGYVGYDLALEGDEDSVVYSTEETRPNASTTEPDPDVYLNATVHVSEIKIEVDDLTAKINLDAQVLNLLQFNAGVDASINEVQLLIQNVNAKVLLEARLQNLVLMIDDTLNSIDLNPSIASLGQNVGGVLGTASSALASSASAASTVEKRSYDLTNNILYSVNDYSGNTHTNRILESNGNIVDQYLDNNGQAHGQKVIGTYQDIMTFNGYETTTVRQGKEVTEREYLYSPYHGINTISAVYTDADGNVAGTQVLAESNAGGGSTIEDD